MKKLLLLVLSLVLVFNLVMYPSASSKADVYIDNQKSTAIDVMFIDGKPFMCIEDVYRYFGYYPNYINLNRWGYSIDISKNRRDLLSYTFNEKFLLNSKQNSVTEITAD